MPHLRRADQHLVIEQHLLAPKLPPEVKDVHVAMRRRQLGHRIFMRERDARLAPPAQRGQGSGLGSVGNRLADLQAEGRRRRRGIDLRRRNGSGGGQRFAGIGVLQPVQLPPLQHGDVALGASLLERGLGVLERQAGAGPPVEDVDEAGAAGLVHGLGRVLLGQERRRRAPVLEDLDAAEDGGGFHGQEGVAEGRPEEIAVRALEVAEQPHHAEAHDEPDAEPREPRWVLGGQQCLHFGQRARQDRPFELLGVGLRPGFAARLAPFVWGRDGRVHVQGSGELPVAGVVEDDGPQFGGQHALALAGGREGGHVRHGDVHVSPYGYQVDLRLHGLHQPFEPVPRKLFAAAAAFEGPQHRLQDADPVPFPANLAKLLLGHGVFPHQCRHAGKE